MRTLHFTSVLVTLLAAALACNPGGLVNSPVPPTESSALTTVPASDTPSSAATPTRAGRLLLNEILFQPPPGQFQFVELKNAGTAEILLEDISITNEMTQAYALPAGLDPLAPGLQLLILFDGQNRIEGNTLHADRTDFLNPESGFVVLAAPDGTRLDHVAWGAGQPGAVRLSRGGFVPDLVPGTTVGRYPASTAVDRIEWVTFAPEQASPGAPNPVPGVEILLPLSGARLEQASVSLSWYPVAGAAEYRVQLASEQAFAAPLVDQTVNAPPLTVDSLAVGTYYWRVQAIEADGTVAEFSPANELTIAAPGSAAHLAAPTRAESLDVPYFQQHKDTRMLLLESKNDTGTHAWDVDHKTLDPNDPADNGNCALASIAMINAFFGGELSQDHIGYEIFKDTVPGPEWDLNYGQGLMGIEAIDALTYALGAAPISHYEPSADVLWNDATAEIDAGRPIFAARPGHAVVITGYFELDGTRYLKLNDPWTGRYAVNIETPWESPLQGGWSAYWTLPAGLTPISDEPDIRQDSDGDGIVDFDETHRFHTGPGDPESDKDKVPDKLEIHTSVFDPDHGYSTGPPGQRDGRDFDRDGRPMELDEDSDDGGCFDGMEDVNFDGKYQSDQHETYNFDSMDDPCIYGTDEWINESIFTYSTGDTTQTIKHQLSRFSLKAAEGGTLEGLAQITVSEWWSQLIEHDIPPWMACLEPMIVTAGPLPLVWGADLHGEFFSWPDGRTHVVFNATPEISPPLIKSYEWGDCTIEPDEVTEKWTGASGDLDHGRYDIHYDLLGESETGTYYTEVHIRQSAGFPGFP